jgi:hypothetical protein
MVLPYSGSAAEWPQVLMAHGSAARAVALGVVAATIMTVCWAITASELSVLAVNAGDAVIIAEPDPSLLRLPFGLNELREGCWHYCRDCCRRSLSELPVR